MHLLTYRDHHLVLSGPKVGIRGEIRAILYDESGRVKQDTGYFPNLITNQGLEAIGGRGPSGYPWTYRCVVGTGDNAPAYTDDILQAGIAGSGLWQLNYPYEYYGWAASPPWMASEDYARFSAGTGTGTLKEFGLTPYSIGSTGGGASGNWLTVRQLFPTPIVKGASDVLDVWYRAYWYFDTADATGQITLDSQVYNYTSRWGYLTGSPQGYNEGYTLNNPVAGNTLLRRYSDGEIGAVTATTLSGGEITANYSSVSTLTAATTGNFYRDVRFTIPIDAELTSQTIRSLWCPWRGGAAQQTRFGRDDGSDAAIPKTDKDVLWIDHRFHYARHAGS